MHQYVPLAGWCCILHDCIFFFLARDMKVDQPYMKKKLTSFIKNKIDNFLIIYPEGTFTTPQNKDALEKSHKWAEENKLKKFYNVLIPRTTGFELIMETREAFDSIIDMTVAFEKPYLVNLGVTNPPTMIDFFKYNDENPVKIHIHYKKYLIKDIPKENEKLKEWVLNVFTEKEELLNKFNENNCFPGKNYFIHDNYWDLVNNFILGWFVYLISGYYWWLYTPYIFYSFVVLMVFAVVFIVIYDLLHQRSHSKPSKREKKE